jgi:hypothetical protein
LYPDYFSESNLEKRMWKGNEEIPSISIGENPYSAGSYQIDGKWEMENGKC